MTINQSHFSSIISWGRNCYGQLGRETDGEVNFQPARIRFPVANSPVPHRNAENLTTTSNIDDNESSNISSVCCGSEHSLALTRDGKLYSFGWNEHGSCGSGDEVDQPKPRMVVAPTLVVDGENSRGHWSMIGAGYGHSFGVWEQLRR